MAGQAQKRILIVDDEEALLITLSDYLEFEGFEVEKAKSAEEALRKAGRFEPHLVVLDIAMPGMGGVGFLKEVSGSDGRSRYPILVLTARSNMEEFFEDLDVAGFLAKPCEKAVLLDRIESILLQHERPAEQHKAGEIHVLLGEDDPGVAAALRHAFVSRGYTIEVANTGPQVLEKAATQTPDVILVKDILMHMNGEAVAALVKAMPTTSETPVIVYEEGIRDSAGSEARRVTSAAVARHVRSSRPDDLLRAVASVLGS